MTLKECYEKMGSDFEEFCDFIGSRSFAEKIVIKFLDDTSYYCFKKALNEENWKEAFLYAHSLKGVSANLYFKNLYKASSDITEELRARRYSIPIEMITALDDSYKEVVECLSEYKNSKEQSFKTFKN